MLDAAHELFLANGYAATSVKAIAAAADVSDQTVYTTFGDKPKKTFQHHLQYGEDETYPKHIAKRRKYDAEIGVNSADLDLAAESCNIS